MSRCCWRWNGWLVEGEHAAAGMVGLFACWGGRNWVGCRPNNRSHGRDVMAVSGVSSTAGLSGSTDGPLVGRRAVNGDKVGLNPGSLDPSTTRAIPPPPRSIPRSPQAFTTACITELPCTHVWAAIALRKRPTYGRPDAQHTTGPTDRSVAQSLPPPRPTQFHFLLLHPCHIPRYTLSLVSTAWLVFSSDSSPCRALTAILSWRRAYSSASKTGGPVSQIERSAARGNRALTEGQLLERAPRRLGPQEPNQDGLDTDPAAVDE